MRITPLDVRKQEFRKAVRGFDCDEVRAFLATLADEYETVLVDNKQIRERLMEQEDKVGEYKTMERTLRDTLMTAEKLMQESKETAGKEGDIIVQGAHQKAKNILEECRLRTEELRREIVGLRKEKETYLQRFKGLAESQIAFIESHRNDFADLDKRLVDLMDSVVDGTINSETEARLNTPVTAGHPQQQAALQSVPSYPAAPQPAPTPEAHAAPEVDLWRDYSPGTEAATPNPAPAPAQNPAPVSNVVEETAPEGSPPSYPTAPPVYGPMTDPRVQTMEPGTVVQNIAPENQATGNFGDDEAADAISEAISATLTENDQPAPQQQG